MFIKVSAGITSHLEQKSEMPSKVMFVFIWRFSLWVSSLLMRCLHVFVLSLFLGQKLDCTDQEIWICRPLWEYLSTSLCFLVGFIPWTSQGWMCQGIFWYMWRPGMTFNMQNAFFLTSAGGCCFTFPGKAWKAYQNSLELKWNPRCSYFESHTNVVFGTGLVSSPRHSSYSNPFLFRLYKEGDATSARV